MKWDLETVRPYVVREMLVHGGDTSRKYGRQFFGGTASLDSYACHENIHNILADAILNQNSIAKSSSMLEPDLIWSPELERGCTQ